jgi:hypothetical protein
MEDAEKKLATVEEKAKRSCEFEKQAFADGTELCLGDICMTCEDGEWDEEARNTGC